MKGLSCFILFLKNKVSFRITLNSTRANSGTLMSKVVSSFQMGLNPFRGTLLDSQSPVSYSMRTSQLLLLLVYAQCTYMSICTFCQEQLFYDDSCIHLCTCIVEFIAVWSKHKVLLSVSFFLPTLFINRVLFHWLLPQGVQQFLFLRRARWFLLPKKTIYKMLGLFQKFRNLLIRRIDAEIVKRI